MDATKNGLEPLRLERCISLRIPLEEPHYMTKHIGLHGTGTQTEILPDLVEMQTLNCWNLYNYPGEIE